MAERFKGLEQLTTCSSEVLIEPLTGDDKELVDYAQRLHRSNPRFKPGYIKCELGDDLLYIDNEGRTIIDESRLVEINNETSTHECCAEKKTGGGIQRKRHSTDTDKGAKKGSNWRYYKKRAIQKKRVAENG